MARNSKRREWTKIDLRELKALARLKTPARKIARTLKRTEGATRQKAFSLGVSLNSRRRGWKLRVGNGRPCWALSAIGLR